MASLLDLSQLHMVVETKALETTVKLIGWNSLGDFRNWLADSFLLNSLLDNKLYDFVMRLVTRISIKNEEGFWHQNEILRGHRDSRILLKHKFMPSKDVLNLIWIVGTKDNKLQHYPAVKPTFEHSALMRLNRR